MDAIEKQIGTINQILMLTGAAQSVLEFPDLKRMARLLGELANVEVRDLTDIIGSLQALEKQEAPADKGRQDPAPGGTQPLPLGSECRECGEPLFLDRVHATPRHRCQAGGLCLLMPRSARALRRAHRRHAPADP